jgi:hypothetical protein
MASGYWAPLAIGVADGPTLTAASAASCMPVTAKFTFPPNSISIGTVLRVTALGRVSSAVTTPGTMRFDLRLGGTVICDSGPYALRTTVATTVPWRLEILATCRAVGPSGNFFGFFNLQSQNLIGGVSAATGDNSSIVSSVATGGDAAPAVGGAIDTTVSNSFDMFFTQTVATGSLTVHEFVMESGSIALT